MSRKRREAEVVGITVCEKIKIALKGKGSIVTAMCISLGYFIFKYGIATCTPFPQFFVALLIILLVQLPYDIGWVTGIKELLRRK